MKQKPIILLTFLLPFFIATCVPFTKKGDSVTSFSTNGDPVYHIQPATVRPNGTRGVIGACYDGSVVCYTSTGEELWNLPVAKSIIYDLSVANLDGDLQDECLVASGDGNLYALDHDGSILWIMKGNPPLYQVAVAHTAKNSPVILAGGIEEIVYSLTSQGEIIGKFEAGDVVRHIRTGDLMGEGKDYAAVETESSGLGGTLSLMVLDPETLQVKWRKTGLGLYTSDSGNRFFSMTIFDSSGDGKDDIILSNSWGEHGKIYGFDGYGQELFISNHKDIPNVPYRMNLLEHVHLPLTGEDRIFGLFGNYLIQYNTDGSFVNILKSNYSWANAAFDPVSNIYYLASSVSGGNGIYGLHLDHPEWEKGFENLAVVGRLSEVEKNISELNKQIQQFNCPGYQKAPRKITVTGDPPKENIFENIRFVQRYRLSEKYGDRSELWCRDIDKRQSYDKTRQEILDYIKKKEDEGQDFEIVAGHGTAVYMSPGTMEEIIRIAPDHFQGFVFTEMERLRPELKEVVRKIIIPLAEKCAPANKTITYWNKNIFWNGTVYLDFWNELFLNPCFRSVNIPALEETNCRTQELSLAGRIGLWQVGVCDHWTSRAVTDNACFDRMWEWSSQQVLSTYLRHLIMRAAYGSDIFSIDIHQGPMTEALRSQLLTFYNLMNKGIIPVPEKDEILSISGIWMGIKSPPDKDYITHGINGHNYNYNETTHPQLVFDRLDCYWAGAPLMDYDFSSYAYGVEHRLTNFLPKNPYGLIPIVPDTFNLENYPGFYKRISTDGKYFYDQAGKLYSPSEYKPEALRLLKEGADRLPVRVTGDVAWSVIRMDSTHVRVILIDPGYVNPRQRNAEIHLQHIDGKAAEDILKREKLDIEKGSIKLTIPAGVFRIVDITHGTKPKLTKNKA